MTRFYGAGDKLLLERVLGEAGVLFGKDKIKFDDNSKEPNLLVVVADCTMEEFKKKISPQPAAGGVLSGIRNGLKKMFG